MKPEQIKKKIELLKEELKKQDLTAENKTLLQGELNALVEVEERAVKLSKGSYNRVVITK